MAERDGVPDFSDWRAAEAWFRAQPREVCVAMAARAALRAAPALVTVLRDEADGAQDRHVLAVLRASALCWLASHGRGQPSAAADAARAAAEAADAAYAYAAADHYARGSIEAAHAARAAADTAAADDVDDAANAAFRADAHAAEAAQAPRAAQDIRNIHYARDARAAVNAATAADAARAARPVDLRSSELWLAGRPGQSATDWSALKRILLSRDEDWEVWTDWYEARLRGDAPDLDLEEARLALPEATWEAGPKAVNEAIAALIANHYERQAAALAQDPRGARFAVGQAGLTLRPGDESAAPEADAMAPHVAAALSRLLERLRLSNRAPPGLLAAAAALLEIVEGGPQAARARSFEMWTQSLTLAQNRVRDDSVKADAHALDEPLDPDSRSALEVAVATVAVYARAFDEVRRFDDALQGFDTPVASPVTQRAVVAGAVEAGALERPSAEVVLKVIIVAEGGDQQGAKAKVGGLLTTRNLVYAGAGVLLTWATPAVQGVIAEVAKDLQVAKAVSKFIRNSREAIDDLLTGAPADVRQAVEAARAVHPTPRPSRPGPTPRPSD